MNKEDTIFYIDNNTGKKNIFNGDWKKIQLEAKKQYELNKTVILKKDDGFLYVYRE